MLEVSGLRAGYGRIPILHGVGFRVAEGETVGVLGHNGMGKTTLIKALMGVVRPTAGRVAFRGADVTREPPYLRARRGMGYVPQGREIFPGLSVLDNLRMGAAVRGARGDGMVERVITEFPRLEPMLDRLGGSLSGGEQQILSIARCLCGEPALVLLDEPTEGIQPSIIDVIADAFRRLVEARRLSVVLVEQNLDFIAGLCERVLVIQKGLIVRELSRDQLGDADLVGEYIGVGR